MQNERWVADRAMLQRLVQLHPDWTQRELAAWIGRSLGWVKKWMNRFREAPAGDPPFLFGKPRGRKKPSPQTDQEVEASVLAIREAPPENLKRVPGPKASLYALPRDPARPRAWSSVAPLTTHQLENLAPSRLHRTASAPLSPATRTSSPHAGLANRFQRCLHRAC